MDNVNRLLQTKLEDCLIHPNNSVRSFATILKQELYGKPTRLPKPCKTVVDCCGHPRKIVRRLAEHLLQALADSEDPGELRKKASTEARLAKA